MILKENEVLELKTSNSELKESVIAISAIINKHGKGEIYFGIKDNGEIIGQMISDKTLRDVSAAVSEGIEPKIFPKINEIVLEGKKVIHVSFDGNETPYFAYGKAYMRVGTENKQISAKEMENMILNKNKEKIRWDNQICKGATLKDIDNESIKIFLEMAKQSKRLHIKDESSEIILKKLGLLNNGKVTNAGILLFGKSPKRYFVNALVKCGRFKDEAAAEFIDIRDFEGNLFDILQNSINFVKEHIKVSAKIEGLFRKEKWEIPIEALREAVINSLIHRDYLSSGLIYIKIYDDKIIIANPGKLPKELSLKSLYRKHESIPKNPLLADSFYYTGMIDVWGKGISNIITLLKENQLEMPKFEESTGYFRIIFNRPKIISSATLPLEKKGGQISGQISGQITSKREQEILNLISNNPLISREELSKKVNINPSAIQKQLKNLKEKGRLKRIGPDKGGHWEVKE